MTIEMSEAYLYLHYIDVGSITVFLWDVLNYTVVLWQQLNRILKQRKNSLNMLRAR